MEELINNKLGCSNKTSGSKQHLGIQTAKHGILTNTKFTFQKRSMRKSLATKQEGFDGLLIRIDMVDTLSYVFVLNRVPSNLMIKFDGLSSCFPFFLFKLTIN